MAYIGNQPTIGQYRKLDDISGSFNGSLTAFTMQVSSTNVSAGSAFQLLISLGGVIQEPGTDFTVSGSTITFTTAPAASLSFFGIMMGQPLNTATPGDSTVTGAKIVDGTITGGKLAAAFNYDSGLLFLDDTNNRVGIGTTSPTALFQIHDGPLLISKPATGSERDWRFLTSNAAAGDLSIQQSTTAGGTTYDTKLHINSSGNIGIGTTSPGSNLEISCDATDEGVLIKSSTTRSALQFDSNPSSGDQQIGITKWRWNGTPVASITGLTGSGGTSNKDEGYLTFQAKQAGLSIANKLRIDHADIYSFVEFGPWDDNVVSLGRSGGRWTAVWATNGTIQTSDQREKTEITNASLGSDFIKSLRPVSYKWIEGGKRDTGEVDEKNNPICEPFPGQRTHWGFIAQEVKQAVDDAGVDFGGWVLTDKDDPDSQQALRYDQFIAPLTKALQEAIGKIEALETANASLEARLTALEGGTP